MTKIDWWLLMPISLLLILGLLILRSIAPQQLIPQTIFLLVSIVAFCVFAFTDFRVFFSLYLPLYFISLALLILPILFGIHSHGALRWLQFGTFSLQPSEVIKPFLLLAFTVFATSKSSRKYLWLCLAFIVPAFLIFNQPDLGSTLVLAVGWLTVCISKISSKALLVVAGIAISLLPITWLVLKPYQKQRLFTFVDPYKDPLGAGYHVIQSITAVGSGQLFGRGLGQGTQSQLRFLPEHHTDFIFASLSEELGFTGSSIILALYLWLLYRIYTISQATPVPAAAHYALGTLSMLVFQIFINVGMNMGIAPITGITLPFLSSGGSSLLSLGITIGLLASISRQARAGSFFQIR